MSNYRLLRDNKESGPYNIEQIKEIGFKPYDLVWVEGRSAAWRYPSEVAELKNFAPTVEEQPFDRFYKKDSEKSNVGPNAELKPELTTVITEIKADPTPEPVTQKLNVFVSLPPNMQKQKPAIKKIPVEQSKPLVNNSSATKKETVELIEKYSQPLDEITKQYAETLICRKSRIKRDRSIKSVTRIAAAVAFIIVLGLAIYHTARPSETEVPKVQLTPPEKKTVLPSENMNQPMVEENSSLNDNKTIGNETNDLSESSARPVPVVKQKVTDKKKTGDPIADERLNTSNPSTIAKPDGENIRLKSLRNPSADKTAEPNIPKLRSLVDVKANDYKIRAFGGVQNLELSVVNRSHYILDNVEVELDYLKPSEQVLRSEKIQFNNVAPNGSMTIKVPDNNRGIKIVYKISSIESSGYDKDVAGL